MPLSMRPYASEDDYWRIRAFLREALLLNDWRERCWDVLRWDYWRWHVNENIFRMPLDNVVRLWETAEGRIAAVLNAEDPGSVFLQVHPGWQSPELDQKMIAEAEAHLTVTDGEGHRTLTLWASQYDTLLGQLLSRQGYTKRGRPEYQRRLTISATAADAAAATFETAAGYTIRALGDVDELPARSWLSWKAFHPDEPDEKYGGWRWYCNVQRGPLYRRDLDLIAVAPDGELAAFCTAWFDDVNRTLVFEPVGTHPQHRRKGLGKAVMAEGLRRGARLGATRAYVGSYSTPAHALYESVGFTDYELCEPWCKAW